MPEIKYSVGELKKIDLSEYYEGAEAYIHIKKIDRLTKKKISYYQYGGIGVAMSAKLQKLIDEGVIDKDSKIGSMEAVNKLDPETKDRCLDNDAKVEELYLLNGIDENKHNFTTNDLPILIDVIFIANVGNEKPEMLTYIIKQIKEYNDVFIGVKKKKGKK